MTNLTTWVFVFLHYHHTHSLLYNWGEWMASEEWDFLYGGEMLQRMSSRCSMRW